jgi:diguanylate cyclase (GGDEF)-like protein
MIVTKDKEGGRMLEKQTKLLKITAFIVLLIIYGTHVTDQVQAEDNSSKKVLILNSYHEGLTWTKEETEGIMQTLNDEGRNISFYVEYMDWKNHNSEKNLDYLYDYYKYKYEHNKVDLIMATDDVALQFALQYGEEIFANAPVVFCGVNKESAEAITKGESNVTGVIEVVDPTETLKIASEINPSLKNVYLLYDNSESGLSTGNIAVTEIEKFNPDLMVESWNDLAFEEVLERARSLEQDSIILITTYYSDATGKIFDMDYVNREVCAQSSVPVYGLYDFGLDRGIIGGVLLSGRLQGENAAKIAGRILDGEDPDDIPISAPNSMRTAFDYNELQQYDISLDALPDDSEIINKPFSFYETYKTLVLSVVAAFIILFVFIYILLFYIRKIQKMKKNLAENNEELTQLYEELTASDEEMKQQYDEIISINEKIRLSEEKLSYLAYHDSLTGLPNKLSLYEESKIIFSSKDLKAALLFIDIDNFKYVNDTMGHVFGDSLIIKLGERLTELLRYNCYLYRLSGDEFVVIWKDMAQTDRVEEYATFILSDFLTNFELLNSDLHVSISIGIAMYPNHATDLEELLKYADIAMYQAKDTGKKRYMVYDQAMNEAFTERVSIEKYLQKALEHQEFEVYYQPQLDIKNNCITGFEALLRWNSPELGKVSPMKFIDVAEDTHFIIPLGTWVLHEACGFLSRLEEKGYGKMDISVNISILQLLQEDFIDIITDALEKYQIEPERLELEITESILMESFERIITKLQILRNRNIRIALDDFGKGYSSLNYLKQLPITTLKVDKSFIDYITDTKEDDFVSHIISIGKYLGMCVVAEGVEVQNQLDYLIRYDCDKIQGFLFCKPVPEEDIIKLLKE